MHVKSQKNKMGVRVHGLLFTALFCIIFPFSHDVFQQNLGRLKKGLARGERLEAFNIQSLAYVLSACAGEEGEERQLQ